MYDYRGNIINSSSASGEKYTCDIAERHDKTVNGAGTTTVTYTRDATNNIVQRVELITGVTTTTRYSGDSVLDATNTLTERTLTLPGGVQRRNGSGDRGDLEGGRYLGIGAGDARIYQHGAGCRS